MQVMMPMHSRLAGKHAKARKRPDQEIAGKEPMQIRIPTEVKRRFKSAAALRGLEPNELFVEIWEHYERTQK
jgi:hypothetical protein